MQKSHNKESMFLYIIKLTFKTKEFSGCQSKTILLSTQLAGGFCRFPSSDARSE